MLDGLRDLFLSALRGEEKADVLVRKWNAEIKAIQEIYDKARDGERIFAQPERKKGHWYKNSTLINCSVCKHCSWSVNDYEDLVKTFKYCPNCGADMREGEKNAAD